jgi:NodT family efflux transporter outer membrane factor (OMF) lipoprotein
MSQPAAFRSAQAVGRLIAAAVAGLALGVAGCTTLDEWVRNGFKVGPNFHKPPAAFFENWIDQDNSAIVRKPADDAWWAVFQDPMLVSLIETSCRQNLDLKSAAMRVLQAQAQRNIAAGNLFPQSQTAVADYAHVQLTRNLDLFPAPGALPSSFDIWATGFNASWELDFWGRLRRSVESADGELGASVEGYRDALVTLLADVATTYVQIRTYQQRLDYARRNVRIQQGVQRLTEARLKEGTATSLDVEQARSIRAQTEASVPPLVIGLRQANDRLCVLLGQPPDDLLSFLGEGSIPVAPPEVAVGVPADLLERRPDVRRALRETAAQSAMIGVAEADFYPQIGVTGFIGYLASDIRHLFDESSYTGVILPNVQWKILNYGRIVNNVRLQDARFREKALHYQQTVLTAGREVEDGLITFLQSQLQARSVEESAQAAERSMELVVAQYRVGRVDFNRVFTAQAQLVTQQDQLAIARGNIALGLIAVYRALGGGWQVFETCPPSRVKGDWRARP